MRVTVLGSAGSYPAPGRACSSYLVEAGGYRLLLDAGNGSLANLLQVCDVRDLDGVVLTHRHHDHLADAYALHTALTFHPAGRKPVPGWAHADANGYLGRIAGGEDRLRELLPLRHIRDREWVEAGPLRVSFRATAHPVPTLGVRVEHGGASFAYSADTGPCDAVRDLADGVDLFLCEATWAGRAEDYPADLHLTGTGAGVLAATAGARRLVVTHVAYPTDPARVAAEAAQAFGAPVEAAADLAAYEV